MNRQTSATATRLALTAGVALSILAWAAPAAAADTALDELVVTARKTEENLKDIPIAVTALSAESMERRLVQDLSDVAQFTPGFQINEAFGRDGDRPVIRGASNILAAEGKVGIFVDGVPFFGSFSALDLENAQRVEVIRGPQSAVFGRGTLSGAINIVTRKPTDRFQMRLKGTAGSYQRFELGGFASGPLAGDWLKGDIGFKAFQSEGMFDNTAVPGTTIGGQKSKQVSAGLYLDPHPDISISAHYLYTQDDDEHQAVALQPASANNCFLTTRPYYCGEVRKPSVFAINTDRLLRPGLHREGKRGYVQANWDIGGSGYNLSYQGGVTEIYSVNGRDQSYDARDFFVLGANCLFIPTGNQTCSRSAFNTTDATDREATTHEVRLTSPADRSIRGRIGFFQATDRLTPLPQYLESTEVGLDPLTDENRVENVAYFGALDWDIVSNLTLGLELRHQRDEVEARTLSYVASQYFSPAFLATLRGPNPNQVIGVPATRRKTFKATLPRATLTWKATPQDTLYLQYAEGNSPGGFNPADAPQTTFDEERLKNYEAGFRTTRWGFDYLAVSVFLQKYEGQVLTNTYVTPTLVSSFRANIGETDIKGLEFEMARRVFTPSWRVQATYTYLDAEITKGVEPEQAVLLLGLACKQGTTANTNLNLPGCLAAASIAGKRPPLVSNHLLSAGIHYDGDPVMGRWSVFGGADVIYRSSFFDQVMNLAETGESTKVNVQLGIHDDDGARIYFWGRNVFDDDSPEGILRYVDLAIGSPRAPSRDSARAFAITPARKAEYGITLSKRF